MSSRDFAVLDLGSNSFHLLVTRLEDSGQLLIIDRLKARVRLAAGLDAQKVISGPYQKRPSRPSQSLVSVFRVFQNQTFKWSQQILFERLKMVLFS